MDAAHVAALLAARLGCVSWIANASVTGSGYLTVTVTADTLAALAVRVTKAGDRCADSDALAGITRSAPAGADLAGAVTWPQAWQMVTGAATGALAAAAGAEVNFKTDPERPVGAGRAGPAGHVRGGPGVRGDQPGPAGPADPDAGAVAAAVEFAGADAIRYALVRARAGRAVRIDARAWVTRVLGNPFFAVCFSHADAASMLRWADDLGLSRGAPGDFGPSLLALEPEQRLLAAISWLPERAAGAARRGQPHEFARYLEGLAGAYLDCRGRCPALPFLGSSAPPTAAGVRARLWLASAAGAALGTGLRLLGIDPPDRV
jgi:hypothetical protein